MGVRHHVEGVAGVMFGVSGHSNNVENRLDGCVVVPGELPQHERSLMRPAAIPGGEDKGLPLGASRGLKPFPCCGGSRMEQCPVGPDQVLGRLRAARVPPLLAEFSYPSINFGISCDRRRGADRPKPGEQRFIEGGEILVWRVSGVGDRILKGTSSHWRRQSGAESKCQ